METPIYTFPIIYLLHDILMSSKFMYVQSKPFMLRIRVCMYTRNPQSQTQLELGLAHILVVSLITKNGKWQRRKKRTPRKEHSNCSTKFMSVYHRLQVIQQHIFIHFPFNAVFKDWGSSDCT